MRRRANLAASVVAAVVSLGLVAEGVGETLLETARENAAKKWAWSDRTQTLELTIVDGRGNERVRKLRMFTRRDGEGGEKSLAIFTDPPETQGTAFLQHDLPGEAASTWSYLPALGRTRRVSSGAGEGRFMGTDFSYADLRLIEKALRWTNDEVASEGVPDAADRFLLRPKESFAYDHIVLELAPPDGQMRSIEMYAKDGDAPTKILTFGDIRDVSGIPTAFEMVLRQPENGTQTKVTSSGVAYDSGLDEDMFASTALEQAVDHVE